MCMQMQVACHIFNNNNSVNIENLSNKSGRGQRTCRWHSLECFALLPCITINGLRTGGAESKLQESTNGVIYVPQTTLFN